MPSPKCCARHVALLQHLARFELHLANRRAAVEPGAFVEHAVDELQPLRERAAIVRIAAHDRVAEDRQVSPGVTGDARESIRQEHATP